MDPQASSRANLSGRVALVTGANSGIGEVAALCLAEAGATVLLGCRDPARGLAARDRMRARAPHAQVELLRLDLADLRQVKDAAAELRSAHPALHLLINNAGVMAPPDRRATAAGHELQLGTNHIGHFALTAHLMPALLAAGGARVVTVSSLVHKAGHIHWDDPHWEKSYQPWPAYAQSKLANLLFTYALQRRLAAAHAPVRALACHPGYAATELQTAFAAAGSLKERVMRLGNRLMAQSADAGAAPTVAAALAADADGGDFYGPDGLLEVWGRARKVASAPAARDEADQERLWSLTEAWTGLRFDL